MSLETFATASKMAETSETVETAKVSMEAFEKSASFLAQENEAFGSNNELSSETLDSVNKGMNEASENRESLLEQENSKFGSEERAENKADNDALDGKSETTTGNEVDHRYDRPTGWRSGNRDQVWENAKDEHGRVRDPVTGKYMSKDNPWDMGHKPGYEFKKHQESAKERDISREQFLDEYYNVEHYRPELPSSNRSHKGEDVTDNYFGD